MNLTRRQFTVNGILTAFLAFTSGLWVAGCATLESYIVVAKNAIKGIAAVLSTAGIAVPFLTPILAAFDTVASAAVEYDNAPAVDKATTGEKLSVVLQTLIDNVGTFFADLNIPAGSLLSLATGIITLVLSTLAGFATKLPAPVVAARRQAMVSHQAITVAPKIISQKEFKKEVNALAVLYGHPEIVLH
jgi:hypothetical protein